MKRDLFVFAERAVKNLYRVLCENKEPILEEENIKALLKGEENV